MSSLLEFVIRMPLDFCLFSWFGAAIQPFPAMAFISCFASTLKSVTIEWSFTPLRLQSSKLYLFSLVDISNPQIAEKKMCISMDFVNHIPFGFTLVTGIVFRRKFLTIEF